MKFSTIQNVKGEVWMCVAVPRRVLSTDGNVGTIEVGNLERSVLLHLTPDVSVNDYVLVHAGCAISEIDEAEAKVTLDILKELADVEIGR